MLNAALIIALEILPVMGEQYLKKEPAPQAIEVKKEETKQPVNGSNYYGETQERTDEP